MADGAAGYSVFTAGGVHAVLFRHGPGGGGCAGIDAGLRRGGLWGVHGIRIAVAAENPAAGA